MEVSSTTSRRRTVAVVVSSTLALSILIAGIAWKVQEASKRAEVVASKKADGERLRVEYQSANSALDAIHRRWVDAVKLAARTPRIALPGIIENLQSLQREADNLTVPNCFTLSRSNMIWGMEIYLNALLDFLADGKAGDALVTSSLSEANTRILVYKRGAQECISEVQ